MEENDDPGGSKTLPTTLVQPGFGLVLDVGSQRRKRIRQLKRGTGKLTRRIATVIGEARAKFGLDDGVEVVPVVILYRCAEQRPALPHATPKLEDGRA